MKCRRMRRCLQVSVWNFLENLEIHVETCLLNSCLSIIVTAFSIERYVAICHPFLSHTTSKLSRAVKYIFLIWVLSICFAIPQALQTGLIEDGYGNSMCTIVEERVLIEHSFELATILFFFAPMVLITVLYILIGVKLRSSTMMIKRDNGSIIHRNNNLTANIHQSHSTCQSSKRVIKMLGELSCCCCSFVLVWIISFSFF